ncbi:hypothetical protein [Streptomyces sp. NPDC046870]|uniref:hypothetical protein n=1 Tax=Streptomyces sp. NPDC046870 TaxID=3155135 RepID=UPI003455AF63
MSDRDEHASCTGTEDTVGQHGEGVAAWRRAVAAIAGDAEIDHLAVRPRQQQPAVRAGGGPDPRNRAVTRGLRQVEDGRILGSVTDEDGFPEVTARTSGASAAALLPVSAGDRMPLFTVGMPGADGVLPGSPAERTDPR